MWQLLCGDVRQKLAELKPESVHMVVTSPPYWGLRKYSGEQDLIWGGDPTCEHEWSVESFIQENRTGLNLAEWSAIHARGGGKKIGQLTKSILTRSSCSLCGAWRGAYGLEPTPELYVQHTVEILQGIRRVLRSDGVMFWNIGDSYYSSPSNQQGKGNPTSGVGVRGCQEVGRVHLPRHDTLKPLDLCLIPERLAVALQEDGWWCRSIIVWHKSNPMPESVNGWRWERHKVPQCPKCGAYSSFRERICKACGWKKPSNRGIGPNTEAEAWRTETGQQERNEDGGFRSDSFMVDCPGCPKCSLNDGLVLRKGSWRPTDAYKQILMLTKSKSYYCDAEAVREVSITNDPRHPYTSEGAWEMDGRHESQRHGGERRDGEDFSRRNLRNVWPFPDIPEAEPLSYNTKYVAESTGLTPQGFSRNKTIEQERTQSRIDAKALYPDDPQRQQEYINFIHDHHKEGGRNLRNIWQFSTQPYPEAHFAVFPEKLPELCIRAATPEVGCCAKCGAPWARVIGTQGTTARQKLEQRGESMYSRGQPQNPQGLDYKGGHDSNVREVTALGWRPTCSCNCPDVVPAIVLDPFAGAGTTLLVAERLGRDSTGIDISASYCALAVKRILGVK